MADFFDYLNWRGDLTFDKVPFGKIDALLLAHLTYSVFDGLVSDSFSEKKTLSQVAKDFSATPDYEERINIGFLINKRTAELMFKCAESPRYRNVELCGFRNIYSEENVEQFAAVTYIIDGGEKGKFPVIALRGTDDTIVGYPLDNSNGFKFWRYEPDDMVQAINCAMEVYKDQKTWKCIQKSAMEYDYSWDKSAKKYLEVYKSLINQAK